MTLGKLFKKSVASLSSSPTPDLDVRVLFEHALSRNAAYLFAHPEMPLSNAQYSRIRRLITRRKKGEPIAYITGHKEFFGLDFYVNKNVLVPRPETEGLLSQALQRIKNYELRIKEQPLIHDSRFMILDVGTGSGCMIIYLAKQLASESVSQFCRFYAADISKKALRVAKNNAERLLFDSPPTAGVENPKLDSSRLRSNNKIKFFHSDLFSNKRLPKKFDLIVANLPYVPYPSIPPLTKGRLGGVNNITIEQYNNSLSFEPRIAIYAGENGSEIIKRFISESKDRLNPGGCILLELDPRNCKEIAKFAKKVFPKAEIEVSKDLAKQERYLKIRL